MKKVHQVIGGTLIAGIATLIYGRIIYNTYKSKTEIKEIVNKYTGVNITEVKPTHFLIERIIDADCQGKCLTIGVTSFKTMKPGKTTGQAIRWGNNTEGQIKYLQSFKKQENNLIYKFEDDTYLTISKVSDNNVFYIYETPGIFIIKKINNELLNKFKTIDLDSNELDQFVNLK